MIFVFFQISKKQNEVWNVAYVILLDLRTGWLLLEIYKAKVVTTQLLVHRLPKAPEEVTQMRCQMCG